jgi:phosphoglycolate phosphatase-like HAD superfamily hydrolase
VRRVLIADAPYPNAIADQLLRQRSERANNLVDVIDMLTIDANARRRVLRLLGELETVPRPGIPGHMVETGYPRRMSGAPSVSVLVTDLDNTLWDWFAIWHAGFSSLLDSLIAESGVDRSTLEAEIRAVHQANRTSEYAPELLLPLLPSIGGDGDRDALLNRYNDSIHAYHSGRKNALALYPGVRATLTRIREAGTLVIAYTESQAFVTSQRILKLGLDGIIDFLYSPPDHDLPPEVSLGDLRRYADENYELKKTEHLHTPEGERKPSPGVLKTILNGVEADLAMTAYVGDSRMKDVTMAKSVGIFDVWARYGEVQAHPGYPLLRRVSHWPDQDVQKEQRIEEENSIEPRYVLATGFTELLDTFMFRGR